MDSSAESQLANISPLYISAIAKSKSNNYLGKGRYSQGENKTSGLTLKRSVSSLKKVTPFSPTIIYRKPQHKSYDFKVNTNIQFRGTNLGFNPIPIKKNTKIPLKVITFKKKGKSISFDNSRSQNYGEIQKTQNDSPKTFQKLITKYNYSRSTYRINNQISYFPTEVAEIGSMRNEPRKYTEYLTAEKKYELGNDLKLRDNQYEYDGKFVKKIVQQQVSDIYKLRKKISMNLDEVNLLKIQEKNRYKNKMERIRLAFTKR